MTNDSKCSTRQIVGLLSNYQLLSSTSLSFSFSFICFLTNICLTRHTLLYRITLPQPVHNVPIQRLRIYGAMCSPSTSRISENFLKKKSISGTHLRSRVALCRLCAQIDSFSLWNSFEITYEPIA